MHILRSPCGLAVAFAENPEVLPELRNIERQVVFSGRGVSIAEC